MNFIFLYDTNFKKNLEIRSFLSEMYLLSHTTNSYPAK